LIIFVSRLYRLSQQQRQRRRKDNRFKLIVFDCLNEPRATASERATYL
jgi:hypothetical protein